MSSVGNSEWEHIPKSHSSINKGYVSNYHWETVNKTCFVSFWVEIVKEMKSGKIVWNYAN